MDLGDCNKIHELALRADYQKAAKEKKYFYELDVSILGLWPLTVFSPTPYAFPRARICKSNRELPKSSYVS